MSTLHNLFQSDIYDKIICPDCNILELRKISIQEASTENFIQESSAKICKNHENLLISISNEDTTNNQNNTNSQLDTEKYIKLPEGKKFFHMNNKILYEEFDQSDLTIFTNQSVLIIGSGNVKRTSVLMSLKKIKFKRLINLTREKMWSAEYFHDVILAEHEDINEKEKVLEAVESYMKTQNVKFDAILTYDDFCTLITAYLASKLGCLGIPYDVATKIKDKFHFRNYCKQLGIPTPIYKYLYSNERAEHVKVLESILSKSNCEDSVNEDQFNQFVGVKLPFIVKNPIGCGKDFVHKCNSIEEYKQCLIDSINVSNGMNLIIEEYYDGHEIDLDILVQNNKAVFIGISDNFAPQEPYFYEKGGTTPSFELDMNEKLAIETIVAVWIAKLNLQNACLHFEARCRPKSLYPNRKFNENNPFEQVGNFLMPIELNIRLGGAEAWSMINAAYNVNLFTSYLNILLGHKLDLDELKWRQHNPRFYCISNDYHPAKHVRIESIEVNIENLIKNPDVFEVVLFRTSGEVLHSSNYMGWICSKMPANSFSLKDLLRSKDLALELCRINLKEF